MSYLRYLCLFAHSASSIFSKIYWIEQKDGFGSQPLQKLKSNSYLLWSILKDWIQYFTS